MKKILSAIMLCSSISMVNAQSADKVQAHIEDAGHKAIANVYANGTIADNNYKTICQIKSNGTILNGKSIPMAFITTENAIQDMKHNTIGYINGFGFEDVNHKTIYSIKPDGAIVNANNSIVGYESNTEPMWVGIYFFLFKR